jgi:hypothetical protein
MMADKKDSKNVKKKPVTKKAPVKKVDTKKQNPKKDVSKKIDVQKETVPKHSHVKNDNLFVWKIATAFVALALVGVIVFASSGLFKSSDSVTVVAEDEIKANVTDFVETYLIEPTMSADITSIEKKSGVYEVIVNVKMPTGEMQEVVSYVSLDGEYFFPSGFEMNVEDVVTDVVTDETSTSGSPTGNVVKDVNALSEADVSEIVKFSQCLADSGVVVYGANWCGYTNNLVDNLGGFDNIKPFYVECTENTELCSNEGITGYPTVKLNGEVVGPDRTFEGFSELTGCAMPQINFDASQIPEGSC